MENLLIKSENLFFTGGGWGYSDHAAVYNSKSITEAIQNLLNIENEEFLKNPDYIKSQFEIVSWDSLPISPEYEKAFSMLEIPDADKEVFVIYRSGKKLLVSGNFLREELLKNGKFDNERVKWNYTGKVRLHNSFYDFPKKRGRKKKVIDK